VAVVAFLFPGFARYVAPGAGPGPEAADRKS
jgi:hypothetical protein